MRKRTLVTAMLTLVAAVAATVAMAGCGGKARLPGTTTSGTTSTTTTTHKHSTKPAY